MSRYIWAVTVWKPMAGPPERTSSFTPVSLPLLSTSVPLTDFLSALTV